MKALKQARAKAKEAALAGIKQAQTAAPKASVATGGSYADKELAAAEKLLPALDQIVTNALNGKDNTRTRIGLAVKVPSSLWNVFKRGKVNTFAYYYNLWEEVWKACDLLLDACNEADKDKPGKGSKLREHIEALKGKCVAVMIETTLKIVEDKRASLCHVEQLCELMERIYPDKVALTPVREAIAEKQVQTKAAQQADAEAKAASKAKLKQTAQTLFEKLIAPFTGEKVGTIQTDHGKWHFNGADMTIKNDTGASLTVIPDEVRGCLCISTKGQISDEIPGWARVYFQDTSNPEKGFDISWYATWEWGNCGSTTIGDIYPKANHTGSLTDGVAPECLIAAVGLLTSARKEFEYNYQVRLEYIAEEAKNEEARQETNKVDLYYPFQQSTETPSVYYDGKHWAVNHFKWLKPRPY